MVKVSYLSNSISRIQNHYFVVSKLSNFVINIIFAMARVDKVILTISI